jgi:NitT/TauT family transport system permease protein
VRSATLGAKGWRLVRKVVIPAAITDIYTDMRILLGWAWTYLIVAEVVGTMSGITFFINQQARYRNFDNVFAAIMMIGIIGLATDLALSGLGKVLFPWKRKGRARKLVKAIPVSMVAVQNRGEPNPVEEPSAATVVEAKPSDAPPAEPSLAPDALTKPSNS